MQSESPPPPGKLTECQLAGYLGIETDKVPEHYNAGFSMYVAAWPLVETYPGSRFQTGLFGTWMHPQYDAPTPDRKLYCDIEGGLGWWRDTQYATETPKFIMGGVALNFVAWANGPGAGKGRDWDRPLGKYGVAQLSPRVLWPPDGLNVKQGVCGQLWGYGYLNLPLIEPKPGTAGTAVPTGGNCWTLFLNTGNFKGPVAFFTPYFFSAPSVSAPELAGLFLDSRPGRPNRPVQMETQYVPAVRSRDQRGQVYARIAPTSFPRGAAGESAVVHQMTVYSPQALWNDLQAWLHGDGAPVAGPIDPSGAAVHTVRGENRASWAIFDDGTARDERIRLDWKSIANPTPLDPHTFGYHWNGDCVKPTDTPDGSLNALPQYYRLANAEDGTPRWEAVPPQNVPVETGLADVEFAPASRAAMPPYVTPDHPESCWKNPGPVAGPFTAHPGDGSTVVYSWYRFADQPALLNADLSADQREELQERVEKLHRHWRPDSDFLAPPQRGELADIDPALLVTPPEGLEIGHVPIATWQGMPEDR